MKIEFLQQIIERIQKQARCPKCRTPFKKELLELTHINGDQIEFMSRCPVCEGRSQISAAVDLSQKSLVSEQKKSYEFITSAKLKDIHDALSHFKEKDVKQLFCGKSNP